MIDISRLIAIVFACFSLQLSAENVTGSLRNAKGEAVPFANVLLFQQSDSSLVGSALSDSSGYFELVHQLENAVYLNVQAFNFSDWTSEAFTGSKSFETITLKDENVEIETIKIKSKKPLFEKTGRGMVVNVSSSPVMEGSNTKEVIEKIPGVVMHQDGTLSLKGKQNLKIFMDGKPTNMSVEDLMRLLETMPSSEIEKIEVFEVPPAKFDAAGNAGIINLITKKGMRLGLNGNIGTRGGYGNWHKFSNWGSLNYRNEKLNVFGHGWYYNNMWDHKATSDILMDIDGSTSSFFNSFHRVHHGIGGGGRYGADYFVNDNTTIGYIGVLYRGNTFGWEPSTVNVTGPVSSNYDFIRASQDFDYYYYGHTHNLNFSHKVSDKESINIDFDFAQRGGGQDNENDNRYFLLDEALTPYYIAQAGDRTTDILSAKIDYENTVKGWEIETGLKASSVKTNNVFQAFEGSTKENAIENLNSSNTFEYDERIAAAYLSGIKSIGEHWNLDLGIRAEYTYAEGVSPTTSSSFIKQYMNWFPNISLAYSIPKKWSLSGAYTSRIDRPNYHQLNPFQTQVNPFRFHVGNPDLNPQISHTFNLTYGLRDAFYFTLSGSQTLGLMNWVIDQQEELERQVHTTENLDKFESYSFNISAPWKIKWYSGQINTTLFYNRMASDLDWGVVGYDVLSFSIQSSHFFDLPKSFKAEISGFYNHDSYWNIWFVEPHYQIDFGASKTIGKLKVNLAIKDFLNIRAGYGGVFQDNVNMATTYKPESRKVLLTLSYRFGNKKVKAARRRSTGSEDLQKRAGD